MTASNPFLEQFAQVVGEPQAFEPMACYNADGDCIEFHLSNEMFYAKRIDGWVTVYLSEKNGEIVGGMIKGVKSSLLPRYPGMQFEFVGDNLKLGILLKAPSYEVGDQVVHRTYNDIIQKTSDLVIEDLAATC